MKQTKERLIGVPFDEIPGFTSYCIRKVFLFLDRLAASNNWIIGIVVGLVVTHVSGIDYLAKCSSAFSPLGERYDVTMSLFLPKVLYKMSFR